MVVDVFVVDFISTWPIKSVSTGRQASGIAWNIPLVLFVFLEYTLPPRKYK